MSFKANAGATQPAVSTRIFRKILLVIILGVIERTCRPDFRCHIAVTGLQQSARVALSAGFCLLQLLIAVTVNAGAILGAYIVALSHPLGGVVGFPEHAKNVRKTDNRRIEYDQHHFVVTGAAGTDFFIGWIRCVTASVADRRGVNARLCPELALSPPEAAQPQLDGLKSVRKRRLQRMTIDRMTVGDAHRLAAPWHGLLGCGHGDFVGIEETGKHVNLVGSGLEAGPALHPCWIPPSITRMKLAAFRLLRI